MFELINKINFSGELMSFVWFISLILVNIQYYREEIAVFYSLALKYTFFRYSYACNYVSTSLLSGTSSLLYHNSF